IRSGIPRPHLHAAGTDEVKGQDVWLDNDDIRPLKLADRTWNMKAYLTFWFSAVATVSNWYAASSAQALGLSMWESIATALGGQILIAIVIVFNGRAGAKYHIGFPVLNRAAFGVFGAWWPTFNRAVMAIVWNGVNGIANLKNIMGQGSAIGSGEFIGCVIFWLVTCTFLVIPVPKMRSLIYAKLFVFVVSAIAMCAWTLTKAGGVGAIAHQKGTATGSERTWLLVRFFFLGAANCATFASNAADFQRYARRPNDVILGNLVGFPLSNFIVCIIGNLVASASQAIYGEVV
ncbi:putative uridine permease, partial [Aureobasidium melanogenum]